MELEAAQDLLRQYGFKHDYNATTSTFSYRKGELYARVHRRHNLIPSTERFIGVAKVKMHDDNIDQYIHNSPDISDFKKFMLSEYGVSIPLALPMVFKTWTGDSLVVNGPNEDDDILFELPDYTFTLSIDQAVKMAKYIIANCT